MNGRKFLKKPEPAGYPWWEEVIGPVVLVFAIVAIVLAARVAIATYQCPARWAASGYIAEYTWASGCQVRLKDGRWVPEKAIRDML